MARILLLALAVAAAPRPGVAGDAAPAQATAPAQAAAPAPAAARPAPVLAPAVARPGDAVLVRVALPPGAQAPAGTLAGRPLSFWRVGDEAWALGALPLETPPGPATAEIRAGELEGGRAVATLEVVEPGFPSRALNVAPRFVVPPASARQRIARDRRAFAAAYARPFTPPRFDGPFAWPRQDRVGGRFGDQRVFNGRKESVHYGLDVSGPRGAPVHASNDGEVVLARDAYFSGKTVALWHGAGVFTLYFHLDRIDVRAGAKVRRGEPLGVIGSTGRSTGPHLHWSARVAGLLVDPESLLGIDFPTGTAPPRRAGPPPAEPDATAEGPDPDPSIAPPTPTPASNPSSTP